MSKKSIAVTGHRPNKLYGYNMKDTRYVNMQKFFEDKIIDELKACNEIEMISGMALGVDTVFANAAIHLKENGYPVKLIAAVPFIGQEKMWPMQSQNAYNNILLKADEKVVVCDGEYAAWKLQKRNEYMVNRCDKLFAIWDGSNGGTGNAVNYAKKVNKDTEIFNPKNF